MSIFNKLSFAVLSAVMVTIGATQAAQAGQLHNVWNYGIDAFGDGSGGDIYDIQGMAIKSSGDNIFIALNSNMPLSGNSEGSASRARGGSIGWGDLFLNFSGDDFQTASQNGDLIGINFTDANDSDAATVGVYTDVTAKSITHNNQGYKHLQHYYNRGFYRENTMGTDYATQQAAFDEFGRKSSIRNVIDSGTFVGGMSILSNSEMEAEGLDFEHFGADGSVIGGMLLLGAVAGRRLRRQQANA